MMETQTRESLQQQIEEQEQQMLHQMEQQLQQDWLQAGYVEIPVQTLKLSQL